MIELFEPSNGVVAIVLKPSVIGGFERCARAAAAARSRGVASVVTTAFDAGVGADACANLARALDAAAAKAAADASAAAAAADDDDDDDASGGGGDDDDGWDAAAARVGVGVARRGPRAEPRRQARADAARVGDWGVARRRRVRSPRGAVGLFVGFGGRRRPRRARAGGGVREEEDDRGGVGDEHDDDDDDDDRVGRGERLRGEDEPRNVQHPRRGQRRRRRRRASAGASPSRVSRRRGGTGTRSRRGSRDRTASSRSTSRGTAAAR